MSRKERILRTAVTDALWAKVLGLSFEEVKHIVRDCAYQDPRNLADLDQKGFWRTDADLPPEERSTILFAAAFFELTTTNVTADELIESGPEDVTIARIMREISG